MTTIKSLFGAEWKITNRAEDEVSIEQFKSPDLRHFVRVFKRADLLAALDAVPRDALAGSEECRLATEKKLAEAEAEVEAWKHTVSVLDDELRDAQELLGQRAVELHKARAERDALAKTVERVRKLTECGAHSLLPETIRAALDPEPAVVLPTEVPARIEAKRDGRTYTLDMWWDGERAVWSDNCGGWFTPSAVEDHFTDHRLLDGAE